MKRIYLACPYTPTKRWQKLPIIEKIVRSLRVRTADRAAARLMEMGNLVFSPLSHSHPVSKHCNVDPCDHDFWLRQDLWLLAGCDEMMVLELDGWEQSRGIKREMDFAADHGIKTTTIPKALTKK